MASAETLRPAANCHTPANHVSAVHLPESSKCLRFSATASNRIRTRGQRQLKKPSLKKNCGPFLFVAGGRPQMFAVSHCQSESGSKLIRSRICSLIFWLDGVLEGLMPQPFVPFRSGLPQMRRHDPGRVVRGFNEIFLNCVFWQGWISPQGCASMESCVPNNLPRMPFCPACPARPWV